MDVDSSPVENNQPAITEVSTQVDQIDNFEPMTFSSSVSEIVARKNDIQRWIENTTPICNDASIPSQSHTISISPNDNHGGKTKRIIRIPFVFRALCYYYISDDLDCPRQTCLFSHSVQSISESEILSLDEAALKETYKYILTSKVLFQHTFKLFVKRFSRLKQVDELISLIDDIFVMDLFDRTPYVQNVVFALQNAGMSFKAAVETLILHHGSRNSCLTDILLNLVIESDEDLADNWTLVKEILKSRSGGEIDFGVVNDIIRKALKSNQKNLCRSVCEEVFSHISNFSYIDKTLLHDFLTSLYNHKLILHYNTLKNKSKIQEQVNGYSHKNASSSSQSSSTISFNFFPNGMTQNSETSPTNFRSNGIVISPESNRYDMAVQTDSSVNGNEECCPPEMDDNEICFLVQSLRSENINSFVALLNKYKFTDKMDSFALNTVVYINNSEQVDREYFNLLKSLGKETEN